MAYDILVVDDEADIRGIIVDLLKDEGFSARSACDGPSTLEAVKERRPNLVILDIWLGDSRFDGIKVLEHLQKMHPALPVIMMSGHGNIETAVASIKKGAYNFIEKPFKSDHLLLIVNRAIETAKLRQENENLRSMVETEKEIVGNSVYANQLRQMIEKVAPTQSRVFITGPSGSGKEVVARQLHLKSTRGANGPFIVVNCNTISPEKFEEELFGIDSEENSQMGLLEQAHLGTLLLDEVTEMPASTQGKFARILQEHKFKRINSERATKIDVRIIATSSRDISLAIREGKLREDLFYRLNVIPIQIKPLKERKEDIIQLANHFLAAISKLNGQATRFLSDDAATALTIYDWPGNVRQLRNVIDWVMIMAEDTPNHSITFEMLPPEINNDFNITGSMESGAEVINLPLRDARELFEKQYLLSQLSRFSGNISKTASFVGMERSALHRKLKNLGVDKTTG